MAVNLITTAYSTQAMVPKLWQIVAVVVVFSPLYRLQQICLILPAYFVGVERKMFSFSIVKMHDTPITLTYEIQEHPKKIFIEIIMFVGILRNTFKVIDDRSHHSSFQGEGQIC